MRQGTGASEEVQVGRQDAEPNHANPKLIAVQQLTNKTLRFQEKWYREFPWLHYSSGVNGILCFFCAQAFGHEKSNLAKNADPTFVKTGFRNWKKATQKFAEHVQSNAHKVAVTTHCQKTKPVDVQLSSAKAAQQQESRRCLLKIAGSVQLLARQGAALRGHEAEEGNLNQLLKVRCEDDPGLEKWLSTRKHDYTSPKIQNEILNLFANSIIREIISSIHMLPLLQYSIIIDGTQDIEGTEQEAICVRYVDHDLVPHEVFLGFYEVSCTTGENLAKVATDVLLRLNLPLSGLRGQTYDGAANMSGNRKGAQARIREMQPLALFVHCGAHCANLVTQAACTASSLTSDALDWVHKLGCLYKMSGKYKTKFVNIAAAASGTVSNLQPLCQTRWTTRTPTIWSVLRQYESVLLSLEDMAQTDASNTGVTARGLLERFGKGTTVLGLMMATEVIQELECLNCTLQKRTETVSGMISAADCVRTTLRAKRTEEKFQEIYSHATEMITKLNIEPITMPHIRRPPKRFIGNVTTALTPTTPEEHYRADFFKVLDTVDIQLKERFDQGSLKTLTKLEEALLTGDVDTAVVDQYPELNERSLKVQLNMFKLQYSYTTTSEAATILRKQLPEVRGLFNQIEALVRLLMVVPTASAEAERSFSALRRLKTWLRSTMLQIRINNVAVCHIHKEMLDKVSKENICQEFIMANDYRKHVFGSYM